MPESVSEVYFPAVALPFRRIADHIPGILGLPGLVGGAPPGRRALRVRGLSKAEWQIKNHDMEGCFQSHDGNWRRHVRETNASHMMRFVESATKAVFKDHCAKQRPRK